MKIKTPFFHINDIKISSPSEGNFVVYTDQDEDLKVVNNYLQKEGFSPKSVEKNNVPSKRTKPTMPVKTATELKQGIWGIFNGIEVSHPSKGLFQVHTNNDNDISNLALYLWREGFEPKKVEKIAVKSSFVEKEMEDEDDCQGIND
jgi:hypothetical protein